MANLTLAFLDSLSDLDCLEGLIDPAHFENLGEINQPFDYSIMEFAVFTIQENTIKLIDNAITTLPLISDQAIGHDFIGLKYKVRKDQLISLNLSETFKDCIYLEDFIEINVSKNDIKFIFSDCDSQYTWECAILLSDYQFAKTRA